MRNEVFTTEPEDTLQTRLVEDLANGLHAMAQPLTVLRGALGALTLRGDASGSPSHYLEVSNKQIDRLCALMHSVQSLLDAFRFEATSTRIDLWELVAPIVEEQNALLTQFGVQLVTTKPSEPVLVAGDAARTELAVQSALRAAAAISSRGDVIELDMIPRSSYFELTIQNRNARGNNLKSSDRLYVSLADANIRGQQGQFEFAEDPFRISLRLALQEPETSNTNQLNTRTHDDLNESCVDSQCFS